MTIAIRPERPDDEERIRAINDAAFGGPSESLIVDQLRGSDDWIDGGSLVAEVDGAELNGVVVDGPETDGALVGHILLSLGTLDLESGGIRLIWMVGPVSVVPERQRRGIGSALTRAAISLATARGEPLLCLIGHADYYPRFGFEPARGLGIEPPRLSWRDANWMALRLPAWEPSLRGTARFPAAFPDSH